MSHAPSIVRLHLLQCRDGREPAGAVQAAVGAAEWSTSRPARTAPTSRFIGRRDRPRDRRTARRGSAGVLRFRLRAAGDPAAREGLPRLRHRPAGQDGRGDGRHLRQLHGPRAPRRGAGRAHRAHEDGGEEGRREADAGQRRRRQKAAAKTAKKTAAKKVAKAPAQRRQRPPVRHALRYRRARPRPPRPPSSALACRAASRRHRRAAQRGGEGAARGRPARQERQLAQAVRQAHGRVQVHAASRPHPLGRGADAA